MNGPHELSNNQIDKVVKKGSIGNYALGYSKNSSFYVKYVGRSDDDLNSRLKKWVGKYDQFKFSYANSPQGAYEKELRNFNDFGGIDKLDNEITPDKP